MVKDFSACWKKMLVSWFVTTLFVHESRNTYITLVTTIFIAAVKLLLCRAFILSNIMMGYQPATIMINIFLSQGHKSSRTWKSTVDPKPIQKAAVSGLKT